MYPNLLLTGKKRSGKSEVGKTLCLDYGYVRVAFATPVYAAVEALDPFIPLDESIGGLLQGGRRLSAMLRDFNGDWEPLKVHPEIRRLLQRMGTEVGRNIIDANVWADKAADQMLRFNHQGHPVVFTDNRYQNEADAVDVRSFVVRIVRPSLDGYDGHSSETEQDDIKHDFVIHNDGTLDDLAGKVRRLMGQVGRLRP